MDILQEKWDDILYTVKSEHELSDMSFKTWLKNSGDFIHFRPQGQLSCPYRTDGD